jgi:hypothetical protein
MIITQRYQIEFFIKYDLVNGGKACLTKAHQYRETTTPLIEKQGKIRRKQATFISNGMVYMQRKMEALCFYVLKGLAFGDQNSSNGEV